MLRHTANYYGRSRRRLFLVKPDTSQEQRAVTHPHPLNNANLVAALQRANLHQKRADELRPSDFPGHRLSADFFTTKRGLLASD